MEAEEECGDHARSHNAHRRSAEKDRAAQDRTRQHMTGQEESVRTGGASVSALSHSLGAPE
jgi:hypothetical protein